MATPFERLMNTIRPHLPGAVEDAILQELFTACNEFFVWSGAWQDDLEFTINSGETVGEIMPYVGRIERLVGVLRDDMPIRGATLGRPDISGVVPIHLRHASDGGDYVARVVLTVSDPTTRDAFPIVPGEIVTRYTQDLIHGVLSRMMSQPSKPYTNLTLAQYHLTKFKGGCSRARNALRTGNTEGSQAWAFPQTFNRRK